jgi:hypothetical protein
MKAGIFVIIKDDIRLLVKIEGSIPYLKVTTVLDLNEFDKGTIKKVKLTKALEELIQSNSEHYPLISAPVSSILETIHTVDNATTELEESWKKHFYEHGEASTIIKIVNDTQWKIIKAQAYLAQMNLK